MSRFGTIAEFSSSERLIEATHAAVQAGYTRIDTYTPSPLPELARLLKHRTLAIPLIALGAGLLGAAIQYGSQYWMNAIDYPLNVGGRPLHSWPAFLPTTIIVAVLWTASATLIGMLALCRLPRLHHPLFDVPDFNRASEDRFFLCIEAADPLYRPGSARAFRENQNPLAVREVGA
jgi:hypothetical protein